MQSDEVQEDSGEPEQQDPQEDQEEEREEETEDGRPGTGHLAQGAKRVVVLEVEQLAQREPLELVQERVPGPPAVPGGLSLEVGDR